MHAEQLYIAWCDVNGPIDKIGEQYAALRTNHDVFLNVGSALLSAAATLALLGWLNPRFRTPRRRWNYLVIGIAIIIGWWAGSMFGLMTDFDRLIFPTCADSVAIPMIGITAGVIILSVLGLTIGLAVSRGFGELPVAIFSRDQWQSGRAKELAAPFGIVGCVVIGATVSAAFTADWPTVPAGIVAIYLVAATWAAMIAPKAPKL